MDLRSVINHGEISNLALGINMCYINGINTITYCLIKKHKQILTLIKSGSFHGDESLPKDLEEYIKKGVRVHINLQGDGLLTKVIASSHNAIADINKLLPGIDVAKFIIQHSIGKVSQITLIRKDDQLFETRLYQSSNLISLSLGTAILHHVATLLPDMDLEIPSCKVVIKNGEITDAINSQGDTVSAPLEIGGTQIMSNQLSAYASALNVFVPMALSLQGCEWIQSNLLHYREKENLFKVGKLALLVTIVALLINATIYFKLESDIGNKSDFISVHGKNILKTSAMHKKQQDLLKAYGQLGWQLNRLPLFYFDQLAAGKPQEIQFVNMECGPVDENVYRKTRELVFNTSILKISGYTQEPHVLMDWINSLAKADWVEDIEDQQYAYEQLKHTGYFSFIIKIKTP